MKDYVVVLANGNVLKLKNVNSMSMCFENNRTTYVKMDNESNTWAFLNLDHVVYIGEEDSVADIWLDQE